MPNDDTTDIKWLKNLFEKMADDQSEIRREMKDGFDRLNNKLDMYDKRFETKDHASENREAILDIVRTKAGKAEVTRIRKDLERTEELHRKIAWLVLSTVIVAVLGLIIVSPF